jgi:4-hydroxythreonine-4-phosphate dehydrogenase
LSTKPRLVVSIGDPNGIGPEVSLKTLLHIDLSQSTPILAAPHRLVNRLLKDQKSYFSTSSNLLPNLHYIKDETEIVDGAINVLESFDSWSDLDFSSNNYGQNNSLAGMLSMQSVDTGIKLCLNKHAQALVTAPISKESIHLAGYSAPGHTEYLMEQTGADDVVMMLSGKGLNVCLLTTHVPLKSVVEHIDQTTIHSKIRVICSHYNTYYADRIPKIALLGINPHAGDGGVLGTEEQEIMAPVLRFFQDDPTVELTGPFPADAFFGRKQFLEVDVVLAAYHDQGLAPFKLWSMGKGVNCTLGLPFIRTSPDHGTAFDIAGKWIAEHDSMLEAYDVALAYLTRATKPRQA